MGKKLYDTGDLWLGLRPRPRTRANHGALAFPSAAKMAAFPVKTLRKAPNWESRLLGGGIPAEL